jgi:hypothetical protein
VRKIALSGDWRYFPLPVTKRITARGYGKRTYVAYAIKTM